MSERGQIRYIDFHTHHSRPERDTLAIVNLMAGDKVPEGADGRVLFSAGIHPWQLMESDTPSAAKSDTPSAAGNDIPFAVRSDTPSAAESDNLEELKGELRVSAAHPLVVLIGEAGFDRIRGGSRELQYQAFLFQALLAREMDKPMVIHCVKGWDELREAYREVKPARPWVIHGFRGSTTLAASLADNGFWFSLGERGVTREVVAAVSHERLLLETDESVRPVAEIYSLFASIAGYSLPEAEALIRNNFNSLLNITL